MLFLQALSCFPLLMRPIRLNYKYYPDSTHWRMTAVSPPHHFLIRTLREGADAALRSCRSAPPPKSAALFGPSHPAPAGGTGAGTVEPRLGGPTRSSCLGSSAVYSPDPTPEPRGGCGGTRGIAPRPFFPPSSGHPLHAPLPSRAGHGRMRVHPGVPPTSTGHLCTHKDPAQTLKPARQRAD